MKQFLQIQTGLLRVLAHMILVLGAIALIYSLFRYPAETLTELFAAGLLNAAFVQFRQGLAQRKTARMQNIHWPWYIQYRFCYAFAVVLIACWYMLGQSFIRFFFMDHFGLSLDVISAVSEWCFPIALIFFAYGWLQHRLQNNRQPLPSNNAMPAIPQQPIRRAAHIPPHVNRYPIPPMSSP